jgi:glycosyltransferase involved in cell wall biosynthesis
MPEAVPTVHILLATYQGAVFIEQQLQSLAAQTHGAWTLTISDDGSQDGTLAICEAFARQVPQPVRIVQGPRQRATANFFHLMHAVGPVQDGDLLAFCDQDDVWLPGKLAQAVGQMGAAAADPNRPLLYCSRTQLVDDDLRPLGMSYLPRRPLGFGNALLQNVANGNTMVFNLPLLQMLRRVRAEHAVLHDWTAYIAATGCGGQVLFDPQAHVLYRQHPHNIIGAADGRLDQMRRLGWVFRGRYRQWGEQTSCIVDDLWPFLDEAARAQATAFRRMRNEPSAWRRLKAGWHSGLWRQTRSGQCSLFLALACKQL